MPKKRHVLKATTLRLTPDDIAAVLRIRLAHVNLTSDNQAIVWAIREIDRQLQNGKPQP